MKAPTIKISKINSTNMIAGPSPFSQHLFINHSSFYLSFHLYCMEIFLKSARLFLFFYDIITIVIFMLNNYLGIVIDPQGNYLTFGQWIENPDTKSINYHGRAFLIALKENGWLESHSDLNISYESGIDLISMDSDFYERLTEWNNLGYVFFLNWSSFSLACVSCFTPTFLPMEQLESILFLKPDILWQEEIQTELFLRGEKNNLMTLQQFMQFLEEKKKRTLSLFHSL